MKEIVRVNILHTRYERKGRYSYPGGTAQKSAAQLWKKKNSQWQLKRKEKRKVIERNIRNENPKMRLKAAAHVLIHW